MLRIVFMGTPEFAVPTLEALLEAGHQVVGVITATDKMGGRGGKQRIESAVKKFALSRDLHIMQPPNLKNPQFVEHLASLKADLQVVVAFRMLPVVVWDMPPLGTLNLHGSLLPAYRGAAPINWAIIRGETKTGVTTFLLKHEIDTGNILIQREMNIGPNDTAGDIHDRMMILGAEAVVETVAGLETGVLTGMPQDESVVSHAPKLQHETCEINFNKPAIEVHNFIRGLSPYPTAWSTLDGLQLNVYRSRIPDFIPTETDGKPGTIIGSEKGKLLVRCNTGSVELMEIQIEGRRRMSVADFLNGYTIRNPNLGQ